MVAHLDLRSVVAARVCVLSGCCYSSDQVFPLFNYGAFPQTWEDPSHVSDDTGCIGDNDPLDVVEIGTTQSTPGSVYRVRHTIVVPVVDCTVV